MPDLINREAAKHLDQLFVIRPVRVGGREMGKANDPVFIDDKCGGAVGPFSVNSHLHSHAIKSGYGVGGIGQNRKSGSAGLEARTFEHMSDPVCLVRVDYQDFRIPQIQLIFLVAQLRELAMAYGSGVSIDKNQDHRLFTEKGRQLDLLSLMIREGEVGGLITNFCSANAMRIELLEDFQDLF